MGMRPCSNKAGRNMVDSLTVSTYVLYHRGSGTSNVKENFDHVSIANLIVTALDS